MIRHVFPKNFPLREGMLPIPRPKISLDKVLKEVCKYYRIKGEELASPGKDRRTSEARGMVAWLVLELEVCFLGELGKSTGRDITTLSSAGKRLRIRSKTDLELAQRMKNLLEAVF